VTEDSPVYQQSLPSRVPFAVDRRLQSTTEQATVVQDGQSFTTQRLASLCQLPCKLASERAYQKGTQKIQNARHDRRSQQELAPAIPGAIPASGCAFLEDHQSIRQAAGHGKRIEVARLPLRQIEARASVSKTLAASATTFGSGSSGFHMKCREAVAVAGLDSVGVQNLDF